MALRLGSPGFRRGARGVHERLALLALGATAAHGLLLLGDPWLKPGLSGVLVPFVSSYRPFWTGLGVLGAYLAARLSLTYYARGRLGARRWRLAHRFIPVAWATAALHVAGSGTDAVSLWLQVPLALTAALALTLLAERWLGARRRAPAARGDSTAPATPAATAGRAMSGDADAAPAPLWSRVP